LEQIIILIWIFFEKAKHYIGKIFSHKVKILVKPIIDACSLFEFIYFLHFKTLRLFSDELLLMFSSLLWQLLSFSIETIDYTFLKRKQA